MNIRRRILPRSPADWASMIFVVVIVPSMYWFELFVVLPALFPDGTTEYWIHFTIGTFLLLNIVGNFTFTVLSDTSTSSTVVHQSMSTTRIKDGWRFCATCESMAPPRSWHCPTCNTCILKRDHHCVFTGCCVGHSNHRYFMMFVLYLFIASTYSFVYNNYFICNRIRFQFPMSIIKIVFPLAIFIFGFDDSPEQLYLLFYIVSAIGMTFTGVLCFYHFQLVLSGSVAHEKSKNNTRYNAGWMENIRQVFGDKWYLAWVVPYVRSQLPHDGTLWTTSLAWKDDAKNQ